MSEGHNSGAAELKSLVERIVRVEDEKQERAEDIKGLYAEAKSAGHDLKALRLAVKELREDARARAERERVRDEADLILAAIGPLGAAAVERRAYSPSAGVRDAVNRLDALADKDGGSISLSSGGETIAVFGKNARAAAAS